MKVLRPPWKTALPPPRNLSLGERRLLRDLADGVLGPPEIDFTDCPLTDKAKLAAVTRRTGFKYGRRRTDK